MRVLDDKSAYADPAPVDALFRLGLWCRRGGGRLGLVSLAITSPWSLLGRSRRLRRLGGLDLRARWTVINRAMSFRTWVTRRGCCPAGRSPPGKRRLKSSLRASMSSCCRAPRRRTRGLLLQAPSDQYLRCAPGPGRATTRAFIGSFCMAAVEGQVREHVVDAGELEQDPAGTNDGNPVPSGFPLPEPIRVSAGFWVTGLSGKCEAVPGAYPFWSTPQTGERQDTPHYRRVPQNGQAQCGQTPGGPDGGTTLDGCSPARRDNCRLIRSSCRSRKFSRCCRTAFWSCAAPFACCWPNPIPQPEPLCAPAHIPLPLPAPGPLPSGPVPSMNGISFSFPTYLPRHPRRSQSKAGKQAAGQDRGAASLSGVAPSAPATILSGGSVVRY